MGIFEGTIAFEFGKKHKRELLSYLLLGLVALASGLYLAFSAIAVVQSPLTSLARLGIDVRYLLHTG
jgi:hypothetical protein